MNIKKEKQKLLDNLYKPFENCQKCPLGATRTENVVFGAGNPNAKLMFIGEGPGKEEAIQGKPFVGRSGQLLNKHLEMVGIEREDSYVTNVVKCRPPNNRTPKPNEAKTCMNLLLFNQIKIIEPSIICTLGSFAYTCLTNNPKFKITKEHGRVETFKNLTIIPIYHPAFILRNKSKLADFINDLKKLSIEMKK